MKKVITVVIIILVVLGFGYYLFKISPEPVSPAGYNSALNIPAKSDPILAPSEFNPNFDHFKGNVNAKNVFVEYGDLQCPACSGYEPVLSQVAKEFTDTVFIYRHFPLVQIHQNSVEAALAAEAAGAQDKFWEMHDILFQKQNDWEGSADPLDLFAQYAKDAGVSNIDQFKSDITSKKHLAKVQKDFDEANALNLQGTPSIFFNGHALKTGPDIKGLKQEAEQYLNK